MLGAWEKETVLRSVNPLVLQGPTGTAVGSIFVVNFEFGSDLSSTNGS